MSALSARVHSIPSHSPASFASLALRVLESPSAERFRRILFGALLLGVFGFAAWQRFSLPLVPIPDPDTWGYLRPVLTWLSGGGMEQTAARDFAYPAFLLLPLAFTGDFNAIVVWQHATGLLAGLAWWWVWMQWVRFLPRSGVREWVAPGLGLVALFGFLCGAQRVIEELRMRPEAVFPLFLLLNIGALLGLLRAAWIERKAWKGAFWAGLSVLSSFVCYSMKPSWGFAVLVAPAVIGVMVVYQFRQGGPRAVIPPVAGAVAGVLALVAGMSMLDWRKQGDAGLFLPLLLVGVHADIIEKHLSARSDTGLLNGEEDAFAKHLALRLTESRANPGYYSALGFNPDFLMFHSDALGPIPGPRDPDARKAYYFDVFFSAVASRPGDLLAKWKTQLGMVYFQDGKSLFRESAMLGLPYRSTVGALPEAGLEMPPDLSQRYERLRSGMDLPDVPEKVRLTASGLGFLGRVGALLLLPASLVAIVAAGSCVACGLRYRRWPSWTLAACAVAIVVAASFLSNFTVAIVHSFDIDRYAQLLTSLNWFVVAAGTMLAIVVLFERWADAQAVSSVECP